MQSHLEPAELFHQLLEHRYLMAERRGAEVRTKEALADYLAGVLVAAPNERQLRLGGDVPVDDVPTGELQAIGYVRDDGREGGTVEPMTERIAAARRAIGLIDLTDLADDHAPGGIGELCRRARAHRTAAVCVWPEYVSTCAKQLAGSGVRVATVVNFPGGDEAVADVVAAATAALADGADDIDLVLPYEAFLADDDDRAGAMVSALAELIEPPRVLKVILETGALGSVDAVARAARLAIRHGADFVKTSTGKIPAGATLDAAAAMLDAIAAADRTVGLKPSGGIRTFDEAMAYIDLADSVMGEGWATPATFRFGASGLLDALLAVVEGGPETAGTSTY